MAIDLTKTELYDQFLKIDFTGNVRGILPRLKNEKDVRAATAKGVPFLPPVYRQNFHAPMDAQLPHVLENLKHDVQGGEKTKAEALGRLESLYAPIYQHGRNVATVDAAPELKRFLAVVSNLFGSFSDKDKRAAAGGNLVTLTPPRLLQGRFGRAGAIHHRIRHHAPAVRNRESARAMSPPSRRSPA